MSQPWTTGQGSELLAPGLRKIFYDAFNRRAPEYPIFTNAVDSTRNYEEDLELSGLGSSMPVKPEGTPTQYVVPIQGNKKRYTHVSYGLGFRATVEAMEDDLYNITRRQADGLGRAGMNVREVVACNVLNNAFDTAVTGFKASTALCTIAHTTLRGQTLANKPSTDVDLSKASLEAALIAFDQWVDEDGFPIVIRPMKVLVHPLNQMVAEELIGSQLDPESSNNAINPLNRRGMSWHVLHYLVDTNAWFVLGDQHDINFVMRSDLRFQAGDDFDSGDAKFKSFQRFSVGYGDRRGIYGSSGAT